MDQGTFRSGCNEAMNIVGWLLAAAAIYMQILDIVLSWSERKRRPSQIFLMPCLLWYVGVTVRQRGFFMDHGGMEFLVVCVLHVLLTGILWLVERHVQKRGR